MYKWGSAGLGLGLVENQVQALDLGEDLLLGPGVAALLGDLDVPEEVTDLPMDLLTRHEESFPF